MFAPDFPDWMEDDGVGIKLTPDIRTSTLMRKALNEISLDKRIYTLFSQIHSDSTHFGHKNHPINQQLSFLNEGLNDSQKAAVSGVLGDQVVSIIHGPPGTGKTTTLIEVIVQLVKKGEKVVVSAPSNTATGQSTRKGKAHNLRHKTGPPQRVVSVLTRLRKVV